MSALIILVNCIILFVALRGTFSMPENIADPTHTIPQSRIEETGDNSAHNSYPCVRNPLKPNWDEQWDALHPRNMLIHGMVCMCNLGMRGIPLRDDYKYTPGIGSHKFHTRAQVWNRARKICNEEGGHLAVINSLAEQRVLMELFNRSGPVKGASYTDEAFLGTHDLYTEGDWTTVLGDSLVKTGFTEWSDKWGGQPDNGGGRQNCGAILRDGTMDDVACDVPYAFFCEIPDIIPL